MFTKTSIALAFILVITSSLAAAEKRQDGAGRDHRGPGLVLINRCLPGDWDGYGLQCDSAE